MVSGRVRPLYGQGRNCDVTQRAPDIIAIYVLQIRLPHHTIGRRHTRRLQSNAASVEEQGDDHWGSEQSRCVPSLKITSRFAHQGEKYTPPSSARDGLEGGRQERQMMDLR